MTSSGNHAHEPVHAPRPVLDGMGWSYDQVILEDACSQARPFRGDETAQDRSWSARVEAAFHSMDAADPDGLDTWIEAHATAKEPHLVEAALVAVWETRLRDLFDDTSNGTADESGNTDQQGLCADTCLGDDVDGSP